MNKIETIEQVINIFDRTESCWEGDNAMKGLEILKKYTNKYVIRGLGYEIIYSINVSEAIENGITIEDVEKLALLNWMIEDRSYFSCFV